MLPLHMGCWHAGRSPCGVVYVLVLAGDRASRQTCQRTVFCNDGGVVGYSDDEDRTYIHQKRELCKKIDEMGLHGFTYTKMVGYAKKPDVSKDYLEAAQNADAADKGQGPAYRASCDRAHFYVQANKYAKTDWVMQQKLNR